MVNTLESIKNLRNVSGAGFLDCKKALEENNNDIEKSVDYLRKKGLIKASKKTSREANEGAVGVFYNDIKYVLIEINTETDFAAKNELFLNFVNQIASYALKLDSTNEINIKDFLKLEFEGKIVSDYFNEIIAKIGENIVLKKLHFIHNNNSNKIYTYTHNAYRENIGKICVALNVQVENDNPEASLLGKNLCMQIAALKPLSIDIENLDKKIIEREKEIQLESIKSSGKEQSILTKIVEGKMNKFYSEVILLNQKYILDDDKTVKNIIDDYISKNGKFHIKDYSLFILGS